MFDELDDPMPFDAADVPLSAVRRRAAHLRRRRERSLVAISGLAAFSLAGVAITLATVSPQTQTLEPASPAGTVSPVPVIPAPSPALTCPRGQEPGSRVTDALLVPEAAGAPDPDEAARAAGATGTLTDGPGSVPDSVQVRESRGDRLVAVFEVQRLRNGTWAVHRSQWFLCVPRNTPRGH